MGYPTDSENMEDGEKLLQEETEEREWNGGKEEGGGMEFKYPAVVLQKNTFHIALSLRMK